MLLCSFRCFLIHMEEKLDRWGAGEVLTTLMRTAPTKWWVLIESLGSDRMTNSDGTMGLWKDEFWQNDWVLIGQRVLMGERVLQLGFPLRRTLMMRMMWMETSLVTPCFPAHPGGGAGGSLLQDDHRVIAAAGLCDQSSNDEWGVWTFPLKLSELQVWIQINQCLHWYSTTVSAVITMNLHWFFLLIDDCSVDKTLFQEVYV